MQVPSPDKRLGFVGEIRKKRLIAHGGKDMPRKRTNNDMTTLARKGKINQNKLYTLFENMEYKSWEHKRSLNLNGAGYKQN